MGRQRGADGKHQLVIWEPVVWMAQGLTQRGLAMTSCRRTVMLIQRQAFVLPA